jgi:hypothetical protein
LFAGAAALGGGVLVIFVAGARRNFLIKQGIWTEKTFTFSVSVRFENILTTFGARFFS